MLLYAVASSLRVHGDSSQGGSERPLKKSGKQCSIGFQPVSFRITERRSKCPPGSRRVCIGGGTPSQWRSITPSAYVQQLSLSLASKSESLRANSLSRVDNHSLASGTSRKTDSFPCNSVDTPCLMGHIYKNHDHKSKTL
jgi:hypothetical protein